MRSGPKSGERRWPLAELKQAVLRSQLQRRGYVAPVAREYVLALSFAAGRTAISSRSYDGFGPPVDQTAEFAGFSRELLAQAADAAPGARFVRGQSQIAGALGLAMLLLGLGAAMMLLFGLSSGTLALGLDLSARMVFALLILACAWPWLSDPTRRAFDPRSGGGLPD